MANPFSITPAGGQVGQGLAGLGQIIANRRNEEQKLKMMQAGKVGTMQRYDLGDRIEVRDTRTGQLVETIPKGVSPQVQQQQDIRGQQFTQQQALAQQRLDAQLVANEQSAALAQQEASAKGEERALKAEETKGKIEASKLKKKKDLQAKLDTGRASLSSFDNTLSTVDQLLSSAGLEAAVGFTSAFPTVPGSEAANFEAILEKFTSQQFLSGIEQMKGMGSLSEAEGKKIAAAAGALELGMSEPALKKELNIIKNTLNVARARELKKYIAAGGDPAADKAEAAAAIEAAALESSDVTTFSDEDLFR